MRRIVIRNWFLTNRGLIIWVPIITSNRKGHCKTWNIEISELDEEIRRMLKIGNEKERVSLEGIW